MKSITALVCLLIVTTTSLGQIVSGPLPFPLIPRSPFIIVVPDLEPDTSAFAYLQEDDDGQHLRLARLTNGFLLPTAVPVADLAEVDGFNETIEDLYASPDNRWLVVYTFQDFGLGFIDHNIAIYDMQTGEWLAQKNEHSFSGLNQATWPSQRLAEYKAALAADFGVPIEEFDDLDYTVATEGADIPFPAYQWNPDGTFSLSFEFDVLVIEGDSTSFIGTEIFTMNFSVSADEVLFLDYTPPGPPANFPATFTLTPNNGPAENIAFQGIDIRFRYYLYFGGYSLIFYNEVEAVDVEGNIPEAYRTLF